jgi:tRNA nucleotidyltransferase (CCA-adding enzyme)
VARERVRHELSTLLLAPNVTHGLTLLRHSGLEAALAPRVREDSAAVVGALPRELEVRIAGWLRGTRSTAILRDLRFSRRMNQSVERILRWHPIETGVDASRDSSVRRHMKRVGPERVEALLALRRAELAVGEVPDAEIARANLAALEAGLARVAAAGRAALQRQDLAIDGREVMQLLGRGPGPHVGRALAFLTDRVIEDPTQNTEAGLRQLVASFAERDEKGDPTT